MTALSGLTHPDGPGEFARSACLERLPSAKGPSHQDSELCTQHGSA
jgi:hypothetical protein